MKDINDHDNIRCSYCGENKGFTIQKLELTGSKYSAFEKKDKSDQEKYSCEQYVMKCNHCKKFFPLQQHEINITKEDMSVSK